MNSDPPEKIPAQRAVRGASQPAKLGRTGIHPDEFQLVAVRGRVIIGADEMLAYDWASHTIRLRPGALVCVRAALLDGLAAGVPFEARVGDAVIYRGVFTTSLSSHSQSGCAVLLDGDGAITLAMVYPTTAAFHGKDPRGDQRIRAALAETNLLR